MSNEPVVTVVGNLTSDPNFRFLSSGTPVCNFTVASTPKSLNRQTNQWQDGEAMFLRCTTWRDLAENVAETLQKGMRVVVQGRLTVKSYEHEGQSRMNLELQVDAVGPELRFATAQVSKVQRGQPQQGYGGSQERPDGNAYAAPVGAGTGSADAQYDPWAQQAQGTQFGDLPPF